MKRAARRQPAMESKVEGGGAKVSNLMPFCVVSSDLQPSNFNLRRCFPTAG